MQGLNNVLKKIGNYSNYYSDSKFWKKIKSISNKAGSKIIYNALLLFYVFKSPKTSIRHKALICGALGYLIFPADLIPDVLIPIGFTDDIAVLLYALSLVKKEITPEIERQAKQKLLDLGLFTDDADLSLS